MAPETPPTLSDHVDEVIAKWDFDDWHRFLCRYLALQFNTAGDRPRANIPARYDDDDLILGRVVDHARAHLKGNK